MEAARAICLRIMSGPPAVADMADFCARLGEHRDRPIHLLPFTSTRDSPSGMWVKGRRQDYVFYDAGARAVHREAIIWHEISHLVLDHPGPMADPEAAHLLLPDLDPLVVMRMLGRDSYNQDIEREAEELASHLLRDFADLRLRSTRPDPAKSAILERLKSALSYRDAMP